MPNYAYIKICISIVVVSANNLQVNSIVNIAYNHTFSYENRERLINKTFNLNINYIKPLFELSDNLQIECIHYWAHDG